MTLYFTDAPPRRSPLEPSQLVIFQMHQVLHGITGGCVKASLMYKGPFGAKNILTLGDVCPTRLPLKTQLAWLA